MNSRCLIGELRAPAIRHVARRADAPLLEPNRSRIAIIEPSRVIKPIDIAEHCVLCFFQEVIAELVREGAQARLILNAESEAGDYPVYDIDYGHRRLAVVHPGVGAPDAASRLERMIALGCRKFIACGGAGVLDGAIGAGHIVVPTAGFATKEPLIITCRPAREVAPTRKALGAIEAVLRREPSRLPSGKTWTTEAVFRETRARLVPPAARRMCGGGYGGGRFFAVARFRRHRLAQILYAGDSLAGRNGSIAGGTVMQCASGCCSSRRQSCCGL